MDTDFWRMQVGKVPGVLAFYIFACVYIVFSNLFSIPKSHWGSHRVPRWLYLSEFDRRRKSCMAWKLRVGRKSDQKMVFVVRFSFWSNDEQVCFQSDILTMEMQTCWLWYLIILPHSHQKDLPVYPFWGSKPHWPSALMVWIRLQASLQNLRHSGFHVNMCGNGCCKYMNQILILLLKYDIEKDGE